MDLSHVDLSNVALVSVQAVLKILMCCCVGGGLARYGLMPAQLQKGVSTLVVYVFTPSLLFVKVAAVLSPERLLDWWPLVVYLLMFVLWAFALGWIAAWMLRLNREQRNFLISTLAFRNTTSLPMALVLELAYGLPILLRDAHDTPDNVADRGEAYILFYTALVNVLRWSIGSRLMGKPATAQEGQPGGKHMQLHDETDIVELEALESPYDRRDNEEIIDVDPNERLGLFHNTQLSIDFLYVDINEADKAVAEMRLLQHPPPPPEQSAVDELASRTMRLLRRARRLFKGLSPPLVATVLAVIVGLAPPLQGLFFGPDAPFKLTITSALNAFANCAIPSTLLVLGAQLSKGPSHKKSAFPPDDSDMRPSGYVAILFLTLVFSAVQWAAIVQLLAYAAPGSLLRDDLVMRLVLMIEGAVPAAVNLLTIASLNGFMEQTVANVLFYSYVLSIVTLTCASLGFVVILEAFPMT